MTDLKQVLGDKEKKRHVLQVHDMIIEFEQKVEAVEKEKEEMKRELERVKVSWTSPQKVDALYVLLYRCLTRY
jgi:DNA polymerase I-like protein with 3'-5' exonuclease and polymerase domains